MSVLNFKLNCIFIAVPRTASSSIAKIIGGQGHRNIYYYKRFTIGQSEGINYDNIFKFSFVRNPCTRFISGYKWTKSNLEINEFAAQLADQYESWEDNSLEELVFRPQWKYICNQYKDIQVDFVGRFENLKEDWNYVCSKLNITHKLTHTNKSIVNKTTLNQQSKEIIANLYRDDFEIFDY